METVMAIDTRREIIRQAIRYFADNDYDRATLDDIVNAIGVTKGAVYHYFKGKEELFKAAVEHVLESIEGLFTEVSTPALSAEDAMSSMFQMDGMVSFFARATGVESLDDYLNLYSLFLAAMKKFPDVGARIAGSYRSFLDLTTQKLRQANEAGQLVENADPEALAFLLVGFGEGAMLLGAVVSDIDIVELGTRAFESLKACIFRSIDSAGGVDDHEVREE
jgi:AcrR family transcriptional regulator